MEPSLRVRQIQLKARQQSLRSLNFAFFLLELFIEPTPVVFATSRAECADDLVHLARLKLLNLVLPIDDNGQRRRLNAAQ